MLADRRTKIVATMGPSLKDEQVLKSAIEAGINVIRLNFSHSTHDEHLKALRSVRQLSHSLKAPVAILQDLQGPKIRVGSFEMGKIPLVEGNEVIIDPNLEVGREGLIPTDFKALPEVCEPGTRILLDDGLLELKVLRIDGQKIHAQVVYGGELKDRKGMNLPGVPLPVDCLTEKDVADLEFGLEQNVDYVALSFVRRGTDIQKLREIIDARRPGIKIIAKIEMLEALDDLENIVQLSDGVMVARGDLAVEVGHPQLPGIQKRIITVCNEIGRPVITATQMLDSMVENPRPTRAEVTDVANAVLDGSDALMLSAETASGHYPVRCVSTMHEVILEVEKSQEYYSQLSTTEKYQEVPEAMAASACLTASNLDASTIVCLTTTGKTATMISSFRPKARIIAMTHYVETLNRLELVWGIQTFSLKPYRSTDEAISQVEDILRKYGLVEAGDRVVLTLGVPVNEGSKTNSIRVYTVSGRKTDRLPQEQLPLRCRS